MDKINLSKTFKLQPTTMRSLAIALLIWVIAVVALTGCDLTLEQPLLAQEPPTGAGQDETGLTPMIAVEPDAGPLGTQTTVEGQGWQPGTRVLIYMLGGEEVNYAATSATADEFGQFTVDLVVSSRFAGQSLINILARADDGGVSAWAVFDILDEEEELIPEVATATLTPTVEPTETAEASPTPTATPTMTPTASPTVPAVVIPTSTPILIPQVTASTDLNVRAGPGINYPVIGLLRSNQTAEATGVSASGGWWQIRVPGGYGWVSARYVVHRNTADLPIVYVSGPAPAPTPLPTSTPVPSVFITDWRGEYYPNVNLSGAPVLVRNDIALTFDWGRGAPAAGLPADNFSARWTRSLYFDSGTYRFHVAADDGVRLWVDDQLLVNDWQDGGAQELIADRYLDSGPHTLRLEYYERVGDAGVGLWWEQITGRRDEPDRYDDDDDDDDYDDWRGEYYDNRHLDGDPEFTRNDEDIDFDWDEGDVRSGMPEDNFSVRWSRWYDFDDGRYRFYARADDGIRVYIDGDRVIDEWRDSSGDELYTHEEDLDGSTRIVVEYYERTGEAFVDFWWDRINDKATPTPTYTPGPTSTPTPVPTGTPVPDSSAALQAALNDLSARTGVPASNIQVLDVKMAQWPNTGLGCTEPNEYYPSVPTTGFQVLLQVGNQGHDYRTNQNGSIVIACQSYPIEQKGQPGYGVAPTATATPVLPPQVAPTPTPLPPPTEPKNPSYGGSSAPAQPPAGSGKGGYR